MARSTHGSRRALPWAVTQKPQPLPRVVRLGRAANDNARLPNIRMLRVIISVVVAAAAVAAGEWIFR